MQLLLEDLNNDRVYVHYLNNILTIKATLKVNSNRGGAHHAEMAKLHYALGISNFQGKNALEIGLDNTVTIALGTNTRFQTLADVRDALLTYEVTTLLVPQQNL